MDDVHLSGDEDAVSVDGDHRVCAAIAALPDQATMHGWVSRFALLADPTRLRVLGGARGVHLALGLPDGVDDQAVATRCRALGVTVLPMSVYCVGRVRPGLVLSYAGVPAGQIAARVRRVATVLRQALQGPPGDRDTRAVPR